MTPLPTSPTPRALARACEAHLHVAGAEARRYPMVGGVARVALAARVVVALVALGAVVAAGACEPEKVRTFQVELDIDGDGTVISAPQGIVCDGAQGTGRCDAEFPADTRVTLQARANAGFVFVGWSEDCAPDSEGGDALPDGDGALDIVDLLLDDDVECAATFVPEELVVTDDSPTLSIVVVGPGSVQAAGGLESLTCGADERCAGQFPEDAIVQIEAFAETGAELVGFSGDCEADFTGSSTGRVTMERNVTCTVSFFAVGDVTYPLRVIVEGNGRVTSSPFGIDCDEVDEDCEARFDHGAFVTLTATADPGWTFVEWGHTCQDVGFAETFDIEMLFGLACSAVFERRLNVSVVGEGRVESTNLDPPFSCNAGTCSLALTNEAPELTATPDAGHRFVSWTGQCSGTSPTIVVPDNATSCVATFELIPPILTIDIVGAGTVTSTDETIACTSDDVDLSGTCSGEISGGGPGIIDPGQWVCSIGFFGTGDGCDCGCGLPDPDCPSSLSSACAFTSQCGDAALVVEDRNHLCYSDDGTGTPTITLIATPAEGFTFVSWQGPIGSSCTGFTPTLVLPIDESATCTAIFLSSIDVTTLRASPRVPSSPYEVAVSADGARVAIVGATGDELMVLDAVTARPLVTINAGVSAIRMATFASDGGRFALSRGDAVIELHVIEGPGSFVTLTGHANAVDELAYGPTFGAAIDFASGDDSGRVKLWSSSSGLVQRTLLPHTTPVNGLAFVSPTIVVSIGSEGEVVTTGADGVAIDALDVLQVGATGVASCVPVGAGVGGAACVVAGFDGVHSVAVSASGDISEGTLRNPGAVAFDIDLVSATTALCVLSDGRARLLDLTTGTATTIADAGASIGAGGASVSAVIVDESVELFTNVTRAHVLTSSSWSRAEILSGRRVVVGGGLDPIAFFDGAPGSDVRTFPAPATVTHLAPSALGGGGVFASTSTGAVFRIDADDGAQTSVLSGLSPAPTAFAVNAAEDRVAVAADTFNDDVLVYELPVGDLFRTFTGHVFVNDVAVSGDQVIAGNGARVRTHTIASGALVGSAQFLSGVNVVAVDANANGAVAVTQQGDFMSLDVATGAPAFELDLACVVDDIALSFDGAVAAVSCADRIVLVDVDFGAPRGEVLGAFRDLRFAPDELVLLAVSAEGWTTFSLVP